MCVQFRCIVIRDVFLSSLLKEAYKLHTGSELELQDVAQFLHSVLESAFVGNCFDFRFSSVEGRVCLSDLLQQSGQRELQTLVTCGFKAPENHLSCTVVTILKCRFPVLQSLLPLPPSPIWPPTQSSSNLEGREDSSIFTLCSTPHDDGLSARSLVGLESISETIKDFSSPHSLDHSCGSTLDCPSFHLPSINLSSNHSDFTSTLSRDNCSTPSHMSAFLVFSQRAWNEFEHSLVHSPDPDSTSLQSAEPDPDSTSLQSAEPDPGSTSLQSAANIQVSGPSTFAKDESTPLFTNGSSPHFRHDTSPELFSEPHTQHRCVPQSGGHFVTPCVPKLLRRRILSHKDKGPTPSQGTSLNERNGHSPDLFTP